MSTVTLDNPQAIVERLDDIERDLAIRQNDLEAAALDWFKQKRDKERRHAEVFMATEGTVAERTAVSRRSRQRRSALTLRRVGKRSRLW